ncbi:hypothetical protein [Pontiella agarivorans]|uniref:Uncharacterized protein n=1 Tax=Pontiella agarivorans TaxID=3038953 RepID=A0ABU5MUS0_9BACT|nr:hypothetical protein [Pontiella agarivorans]MDZ8117957.1 hypothetical protein [Pontiella agarivorans]
MRSSAFQTLDVQDAWAAHLQEVFQTLEIPKDPLADHVAASVAVYCRQYHPQGVQRADLVLLIARAFSAVNQRAVAERAIGSLNPHRRHVDRWLEILSELDHFPQLLPYFSLGVIRPADWAGAQLDRMWTLDFSILHLSEAEKHEMMLYRTIRAIVDHMYVFWDATSGEGVLGLKGLDSFNVEEGVRSKQTLTQRADLLDYIADLFGRQNVSRKWSAVPSLLNLDL